MVGQDGLLRHCNLGAGIRARWLGLYRWSRRLSLRLSVRGGAERPFLKTQREGGEVCKRRSWDGGVVGRLALYFRIGLSSGVGNRDSGVGSHGRNVTKEPQGE